MPPTSRPSNRPARLALAGGFGGLLALLLLLGFYASQVLDRVRVTDAESSRVFLVRQDLLESVRFAAYAASRHVRDYLIDPDVESYERHRNLARDEWAQVRTFLNRYRAVASTPTLELTNDLDAYWAVADQALNLDNTARKRTGFDLLASQLGPGRERFQATIDHLRTKDQADLRGAILQSAEFLNALQSRLAMAIGMSMLLGSTLVALTWRYLARLEAEASSRYEESVASAAKLEQLSHRLLIVQEEERRHLARELHDEVAQSVGALLVDLGQARREPQDKAEPLLHSAMDLGEKTLREIRDICLILRPSMLDDLGLIPALHWQARETSRRTGMNVQVDTVEDDLVLPDEIRTAVYRVVQEALQNAARHSKAKVVEVALLRDEGRLRIMVKDDGVGFDPAVNRGLGLLGMQERVAQLGGLLRVASAPGQGTMLTFDVPLDIYENSNSIGGRSYRDALGPANAAREA